MRQPIHYHYDQLTDEERAFVDEMFTPRRMYFLAKAHKIDLAGDDRIERAVDALARAVIESRPKPVAMTPDEIKNSNTLEAQLAARKLMQADDEPDLSLEIHSTLKLAGFL